MSDKAAPLSHALDIAKNHAAQYGQAVSLSLAVAIEDYAAEQNARLQYEVERWQNNAANKDTELADIRAQNARYRAALETIRDKHYGFFSCCNCGKGAEEALKEGETG